MLSKILNGPSEWIVRYTSAKSRRSINFWLFVVWFFPGLYIWWVLKDALWFVGFMSIYAILVSHWGNFSAETPVEDENDSDASGSS